MILPFEKEYLDVVLVPGGLLVMFLYHLFLLYRYLHKPLTTVLGYENRDKRVWVDKVLQASYILSSPITSISLVICKPIFLIC